MQYLYEFSDLSNFTYIYTYNIIISSYYIIVSRYNGYGVGVPTIYIYIYIYIYIPKLFINLI